MSEIRIKDNESLDSALRRFKRSCARSGVLAEVRKREHYEKPSVKRKKKSEAALQIANINKRRVAQKDDEMRAVLSAFSFIRKKGREKIACFLSAFYVRCYFRRFWMD